MPCEISSGLSAFERAPRGEVVHGALHAEQAQLVGLADDGHDQTPVQGHGNSDVDVVVLDQLLAVQRRIHRGVSLQGGRRSLQEERQEGQLGAVLLQELVLGGVAQLGNVCAINGVHGRDVRGGPLGPHHVLGDAQAHRAERLDIEIAEARFGSGREGRCRQPSLGGPLLALDVRQDVLLGDAAARSRALAELGQLDSFFLGDAAYQRRAVDAPAGIIRGRPGHSCGSRLCLLGRCGRLRLGGLGRDCGSCRRCVLADPGAVAYDGYDRVDLDCLALGEEYRFQHARVR